MHSALTPSQFLTWVGEVPYLMCWTPQGDTGVLSAKIGDEDFAGATPWSQAFPTEMVEDIGLDHLANHMAAIQHAGMVH